MCACILVHPRVLACGCVILGVFYIVVAPSVGVFPGKDLLFMSTVLVSPGDVVSTSVGVLHVQSVIVERSREDVSFAMSGVDGGGWVRSNIPVTEGVVPLAVDVSDAEALVWFDRVRRLRRLGDAVFSPGAGFEVILRNCEKLLDGIGFFAVSEWEHLEEFEGKVANEVPGADTEYGHLEGELIGVSPVGLFVGDIVRLGACDGIEYLQVVEVSADRFKMKNLTRGGFDTLTVKGTPFERENEEGVEWYGYSIVLEGPIVDEYCHNFMVLPTRDPELVGEFDALYSLQGSLINKFGWGIRDSLESFEEAEQGEVVASAGVSPAEARRTFMVGLLREIESLVNKARYSGSMWRLQHLEREVSELIVSRFEEEEKTVRGRIDKLREALETVVEINSQK